MAVKMPRRPVAKAAPAAENDLDVLHPERMVVLAGKPVTVREYGHIEWMRLQAVAAPLVAALAAMLDAGQEPTYEQALAVMAQNIDALAPLVMQAADMTPFAFDSLKPDDGELLMMTWWGCNGLFFVRRALNKVAVARAEAARSAGARSTPP